MKPVFFLLLLLVMGLPAYPQVSTDYQEHSYYLDVYDNSGHRLGSNSHSNMSGSPLLYPDWGKGSVMLKNGRQLSGIPLEFNVQDNKLYFEKDSAAYTFADPVLAFKMTYKDGDSTGEVFFRSGYPNRKGDSTLFLYEVINDGPNVHFLKQLNSAVRQQYVYGSAAKETYVITDESFLFDVKHNLLVKIANNKKSILRALPGYSAQIETFSGDNTVSFTNDRDINRLITYLNRIK